MGGTDYDLHASVAHLLRVDALEQQFRIVVGIVKRQQHSRTLDRDGQLFGKPGHAVPLAVDSGHIQIHQVTAIGGHYALRLCDSE